MKPIDTTGHTMNDTLKSLGLGGIIPVVVIEDASDAEPLAQALISGGMTSVEVTFRTDAALKALGTIARHAKELTPGAGSVLSVEQAKSARDAGATFIVSPGVSRGVIEYCLESNLPVLPGIATPSEAAAVIEYGLRVAKFFPAEASGGVAYLKAMSAPFRDLKFVPTGGVDESNLLAYLRMPQVLACGGSWMVKAELLRGKKFDEISSISQKAISLMLGFGLRHVGVNCDSADVAQEYSSMIGRILNLPIRDTTGSIFSGSQFEFLKSPYLGKHGHIALSTNSIERAIFYLERRGVAIKPETKGMKDGKLSTVYLDLDLAGFALHLVEV